MAKYVDGFVFAIPEKNLAAYRRMARVAGKVWKKHGALDYKECIADDLNPEGIKFPFSKAVRLKPGETVAFSYIVYKSRAHRDKVNAKVMSDPEIKSYQGKEMPFDFKRFAYGGFEVIVDL